MIKKAVILLLTFLLLFSHFIGQKSDFDWDKAAQIPVVHRGRIKPLDSVARNSLLFLLEKQTFKFEGKQYTPISWLFTVISNPEFSDTLPVFRINHPSLRETLFLEDSQKTISFSALHNQLEKLMFLSSQFQSIPKSSQNPFQKEVIELTQKLDLYAKLKFSFFGIPTSSYERLVSDYRHVKYTADAILNFKDTDEPTQEEAMLIRFFQLFDAVEQSHVFKPIPLMNSSEWVSYGEGILMELAPSHPEQPLVSLYATAFDQLNADNAKGFNETINTLLQWHVEHHTDGLTLSKMEVLFNAISPFYKSTLLYIITLIFLFISYFRKTENTYLLAVYATFSAFSIHSLGLISRMVIQGRPPVTNLYSSAIFVGWAAILFCLLLEHRYRNSIGIFIASLIGISTLIIAHQLSIGGDTLEMMRAVLDSNFWLATHVITVTIGYSATFVAGGIALIYICLGLFSRKLNDTKKKELQGMLLSTLYVALFFSFVGTVLGGIWADQSWGRFWGWDPKENGALLIVLWVAIIIHARLAGFKQELLMVMSVAGNIITAFSWFGVNLLGVGLHSYGFMEKGFYWLMIFIATQVIFIVLGLLPKKYWATPSSD